MEFNKDLINTLSQLPNMCVFALVNEKDKKIFIGKTTNLVTYLGRLINECQYSNKELLTLPFIILESITDKPNLYVRFNYWINYYSNKGYLIYKKPKYRLNYKLRIDLMGDFRMQYEARHLFYVKILSRRYRELVIGVFDKIYDAEAFIADNYPNGIESVVYSSNSLTKEYFNVK